MDIEKTLQQDKQKTAHRSIILCMIIHIHNYADIHSRKNACLKVDTPVCVCSHGKRHIPNTGYLLEEVWGGKGSPVCLTHI